jgi:L-lysine 2,3-aminomutase
MFDATTEKYIDHEVRIRLQEGIYKQINRKIDILIGTCGAIFTVIIIPVVLHSLKLV